MFFIGTREVDMEYYLQGVYRRILFNKLYDINKVNLLKEVRFFFLFRNILMVSQMYIFNYILFVWLITGNLLLFNKYGFHFQRGVYYYRFLLVCKDNDFTMLDFLLNYFFCVLGEDDIKLCLYENKKIRIQFRNYDIFSNMRLSHAIYLYELDDSITIEFHLENYHRLFASLLKLNAYIRKMDD